MVTDRPPLPRDRWYDIGNGKQHGPDPTVEEAAVLDALLACARLKGEPVKANIYFNRYGLKVDMTFVVEPLPRGSAWGTIWYEGREKRKLSFLGSSD